MQKMAGVFLRIVVFACFLSVAMAAAVFSSFREAGVSLGQIVARVGMCGLAFTAIASAVIGRSAALYRLDYSSLQKDEKRYEASLESLGKVPLVALVIFVVLNSLYLWGLFLVRPVGWTAFRHRSSPFSPHLRHRDAERGPGLRAIR